GRHHDRLADRAVGGGRAGVHARRPRLGARAGRAGQGLRRRAGHRAALRGGLRDRQRGPRPALRGARSAPRRPGPRRLTTPPPPRPAARRRRIAGNTVVVWICGGIVGLAVLLAIFGPLLAPHDPNAADLSLAYVGPTAGHPLGFDGQGADLLSRLLAGAR